jgi:AraC-like DNA-binding protein
MQIRKQENTLSLFDLMQFPAWEYALDEEVVQGQNEKTIRPYLIHPPLNRENAYFLVRASFTLANGVSLIGLLKPLKPGEDKLMKHLLPYDLNPVIVTDQGHVTFCYGVFKPDEVTISENYKRLGYELENVFPIKFKADVEVWNSVDEGVLEGFLYIEQDSQAFFGLKPSDIKYVK